MLISMREVEDERGAVLELNEKALLQGEIPAIDNAHYLDQGPILLNGLILGQYKGGKLEMRILLKGGDIPKLQLLLLDREVPLPLRVVLYPIHIKNPSFLTTLTQELLEHRNLLHLQLLMMQAVEVVR